MYGATIGKLWVLSQPSTTNQACCAFIGKDESSLWYLFHYLKHNKENIIALWQWW
jgi:type I restriction enzyme S subunit